MKQTQESCQTRWTVPLGILTTAALVCSAISPSLAQVMPMNPDEIRPPSPEVGARVPGAYFGPTPSETQKELIGPYKLLKAGRVDEKAFTVTLPLYQGRLKDGRKVWYILTDTTDEKNAEALGLNFSAKLNYGAVGRGARSATLDKSGTLVFDRGSVDFRPAPKLVPGDGENAFPPKQAQPGSVGDRDYTPLIRITNAGNHVYNAPIIAFDVDAQQISFPNGKPDYRLVHDKVVRINPAAMTVTLQMTPGMSFARPIAYISFDSNNPVAATLEGSTLAPGLSDIQVGGDDSAFSAVERLFITANGPMGKGNPQRQGLNSAIVDGNGPLNVFGGVPTIALDYSPLWDANIGVWTPEAIQKGYRSRLMEEFQILRLAQQGWLTGPDGKEYGSTGIIINCPLVMRLL